MLILPKPYAAYQYVTDTDWSNIFTAWQNDEEPQIGWQKHWQAHGFTSWQAWRQAYITPIRPETLNWSVYNVPCPTQNILNLYAVPARSWIDTVYPKGKITQRISTLCHHPMVMTNTKIADIRRHFPSETLLVGLICHQKIILIEGQHRSLALATWNPETPFTRQVQIALTNWAHDLPVLGGNYNNT